MLRLYDTARQAVTDIVPRDPGKLTLYVCGPTVYDAPHIGHGRSTLVYDVLRRYLTYAGFAVQHVSNITDIDDKIIDRANAEGIAWHEVAAREEERWWSTMESMGVLKPNETPHASEYLDQMIELIDALIAKGHAYVTSDGVYLSVADVADYGLLKHQDLESLLAGARVDVIEEKRAPGDFALWKIAKPNEPSWTSPYGEGRPGWHTECVVMSLALLGEGFDLHGGGQDLIFPHHENERAQAVAVESRFARNWVHHGLVTRNGEKMSKSLGNFTTLADLLDQTDPRAYRLLVLSSYYRSPLEVSADTLNDAKKNALSRIDALSRHVGDHRATGDQAPGISEQVSAVRDQFNTTMDDDLSTPRATGQLFEVLRRANTLLDNGDHQGGAALAGVVLELLDVLGVTTKSANQAVITDVPTEVGVLAWDRDVARAARDFAKADELRKLIESLGYRVEDTAGGTRIYR